MFNKDMIVLVIVYILSRNRDINYVISPSTPFSDVIRKISNQFHKFSIETQNIQY